MWDRLFRPFRWAGRWELPLILTLVAGYLGGCLSWYWLCRIGNPDRPLRWAGEWEIGLLAATIVVSVALVGFPTLWLCSWMDEQYPLHR